MSNRISRSRSRKKSKSRTIRSKGVNKEFVIELKDLINWSDYLDDKSYRLKKWHTSLSNRKPARNNSDLSKWRNHLKQREKCMKIWETNLYKWENNID